jgi:hypothetical protein
MADADGWKALGREQPVNEANVRAYRLLAEAQSRLARELLKRGASEEIVLEAFDRCANRVADREDVQGMCAEILTLCAADFGARLELRAVFGDGEVTLLHDSDLPDRD